MDALKLSVCYIVKNEENNLPISLASVKAAADEIIVVDTGSQDNTKEIARRNGAIVYDFPWQDDFSAPRNYAIEKASGDWILFLDADEAFNGSLDKQALGDYLAGKDDKDAILLIRHNVESWEEIENFNTDWALRIFRRREDLRYRRRIHEQLHKSSGELKIAYAPADFYLLHTGYANAISTSKCQRDLYIMQQIVAEGEWEPVFDYYLTDCCYGTQQYEQALVHAQRFIHSGTEVFGGNGHSYRMILECMRHLSLPDKDMLPWADEACRLYPDLPDFYAERGMILCGLGRLGEAEKLLVEALNIYNGRSADWQHDTYFSREVAAKVAARLGEIAALNRQNNVAANWFVKAMDYYGKNGQVLKKAQKFLRDMEKGKMI